MVCLCSQVVHLIQVSPGSGLSWALRLSLSVSCPGVYPEVNQTFLVLTDAKQIARL